MFKSYYMLQFLWVVVFRIWAIFLYICSSSASYLYKTGCEPLLWACDASFFVIPHTVFSVLVDAISHAVNKVHVPDLKSVLSWHLVGMCCGET